MGLLLRVSIYQDDGEDGDGDKDDSEGDVGADDRGGEGLPVLGHQTQELGEVAGVGLVWVMYNVLCQVESKSKLINITKENSHNTSDKHCIQYKRTPRLLE